MYHSTRSASLQPSPCLMPFWPQAQCSGRLWHRPALSPHVLAFLGALLFLLSVVGSSQAAGWVYIDPQAFTQLCPRHIAGDREYAGNGPEVLASATLRTNSTLFPTELYVYFSMDQRETRSDWSAARLFERVWLYSTPPGQIIRFIWNARRSEVFYVDTDHALDRFFPTDTLVQEFAIIGDTKGNDLGNCTADDAYLSVYLKPLWLWVE